MPTWGIVLLVILPILAAIGGFVGGLFFTKKKYWYAKWNSKRTQQ